MRPGIIELALDLKNSQADTIVSVTSSIVVGLKATFIAARPKHWIKNLLIFALPFSDGLLVGGNSNLDSWIRGLTFFACLSLVSSANYIFNDVLDRKRDAVHPVKSQRPISSGELSVLNANLAAVLMALAGLTLSFYSNGFLGSLVVFGFGFAQFLYSILFKHFSGFDVVGLAALYLFRGLIPYSYEDVVPSQWFFVIIFAGALFLSAGKRYSEMLSNKDFQSRPVLRSYSRIQLIIWIGVSISLIVTSYLIWSFSFVNNSNFIILLVGIMPLTVLLIRITGIVISDKGEDPTKVLLEDKASIILITILAVLYLAGKGYL
jgi:decaprenyl-phosphate phosphoribosyltransferase